MNARHAGFPAQSASVLLSLLGLGCGFQGSRSGSPEQTAELGAWSADQVLFSPAEWSRFKVLWRKLEQEAPAPSYPEADRTQRKITGELAHCFSIPEREFWDAMHWTALSIARVPGFSRTTIIPPAKYALVSLALFRSQTAALLTPRTMDSLGTGSRAMPPGHLAAGILVRMENIEQRVDELRQLRKRGALPVEALMSSLEMDRLNVYRHRALRIAAEIHSGFHPAAGPIPEPVRSSARDLLMWNFLHHPARVAIGSEASIQRYDQAVRRIIEDLERSTDQADRARAEVLQHKQTVLSAEIQKLETIKPDLERLFADLENPVGP